MKGQLDVKTPAEYLAAVDEKRRPDIAALDALIRTHAPELEPVIMGGMLGYGPFHYRYASGREGDAAVVGFSPRVGKLSLYLNDGTDQHAEALARLGRHSVTKACLHVKRLADVDLEVLAQILQASYESTRDAHA